MEHPMAETLDHAEAAPTTSPATTTVTTWLTDFEAALTAGDIDTATEMFAPDCYWRDLVSFTWNIVTVEGHEGVRDMLRATLERVRPTRFRIAHELDEPDETGGGIPHRGALPTPARRGNRRPPPP